MSNRAQILKAISKLMAAVKNSGSTEERFTHLDNIALLSNILQDVTNFENKLISEIDVD